MKPQVGRYFFGRHYNVWGIWQYDFVSETTSSAKHIKDVLTYDDAVKEMYRLNGWGMPKVIHRSY